MRMGLDTVEFKQAGLVVERAGGLNEEATSLTLLCDFSYEFVRGERIGIVGRNGGKTTFRSPRTPTNL